MRAIATNYIMNKFTSEAFMTDRIRKTGSPLPATGFLRQRQIIGDARSDPPIPPLIPVGKTAWWAGVKSGRYPKPVKIGPRTTAWRVEDIRALIEAMGKEE